MITIVMAEGTTSKGNLLTIERKRRAQLRRLHRYHASAAPDRRDAIRDRIQHIEQDLITIAADLDGVDGLDIPEPLEDDGNGFLLTANLPVSKPGLDTIEKIKQGLLPGFEFVNPEAYKLMQTDRNGTGGTRPNGRFTIEAARGRVHEVVVNTLNAIAQRRREAAAGAHETILIVLMYTSFGGFASGVHEVIEDIWERETSERQFPVQILPLLLLPHGYPPDDAFNTNGVSYGVIKELSANATKRRIRREVRRGESRKILTPQTFRQTLLLTDTTLAGGQPRTVPRRNFNGMVAQLIMDLATTPLGERVIAKLTDFNASGQAMNVYGESRHGITLGVSSIVLDRDRLFLYLAARLRSLIAEHAIQVVDADEVLRDTRGFLEGRRIVEGDGRDDLSSHLLQMRLRNDVVSPERTVELFRVNASNLMGVTLFRQGAEALDAAIQQNGDLGAALATRGQSVIESTLAVVDAANRAMAGDPQRRLGSAWQRTDSLAAIAANMANLAAADTANLQDQVATAEARVHHYQNIYIPQLERKSFLYRRLHGGRIEGEAEDYRRSLLALYHARCRLLAHQAAVEVINGLHQPLKNRADQLQSCIKTINDEITVSGGESARIVAHSADMECPVGLPLLASPQQFEELRGRLLPETDHGAAIAAVYARLRESEDLLATLSAPGQLRAALDLGCEDVLRNRVEALHVADELRLRYDTSETLGPVLQERDFEATERLVLRDSADAEQQPVLVRLIAMDTVAAGTLIETMNEYAQPRGHSYTTVNTGDRDRIVIMQLRAGFALSDWVRTREIYPDYAQAPKLSRVERHHTTVGARALPEIGRLRSVEDDRVTAVRAWLLNRLRRDQSGDWLLKPVDSAFADEHLGPRMELLTGSNGYAIAVDVTSHFECCYFEAGPKAFEDGLARLKNLPADAGPDEKEIAKLFEPGVEERFRVEMAWWSDNSMPGAMDWHRAKAREGSGVMAA